MTTRKPAASNTAQQTSFRVPNSLASRSQANSPVRSPSSTTHLVFSSKLVSGLKGVLAKKLALNASPVNSKTTTSTSSIELPLYSENTEEDYKGEALRLRVLVRSLKHELDLKERALNECKALLIASGSPSPLTLTDTNLKRRQPDTGPTPKTSTGQQEDYRTPVKESRLAILKLRSENTKLKQQLGAQSPREEILSEVENQFKQFESMKTDLLAENKSLKDKLAQSNPEASVLKRFTEFAREVSRLRTEMSQLNRVMKSFRTEKDFCLNDLFEAIMEPGDADDESPPIAKCSRELVMLKGEVTAMRREISDSLAEKIGSLQYFVR